MVLSYILICILFSFFSQEGKGWQWIDNWISMIFRIGVKKLKKKPSPFLCPCFICNCKVTPNTILHSFVQNQTQQHSIHLFWMRNITSCFKEIINSPDPHQADAPLTPGQISMSLIHTALVLTAQIIDN